MFVLLLLYVQYSSPAPEHNDCLSVLLDQFIGVSLQEIHRELNSAQTAQH